MTASNDNRSYAAERHTASASYHDDELDRIFWQLERTNGTRYSAAQTVCASVRKGLRSLAHAVLPSLRP